MIVYGHSFAQTTKLRGRVVNEQNKPIEFATVSLKNLDRVTFTDIEGNFTFQIPKKYNFPSYELQIAVVGKQTLQKSIPVGSVNEKLIFTLLDLSLSLNEVEISQVRKSQNSNSSIVFDRQAIEQIQAFSLVDVLNNLPGKPYSALDLQGAKNITLRTDANGNSASNNAMGTAIIIDGQVQSNNANMQNKSFSKYQQGTINDTRNGATYDVTFGGIDLREIPADNIESVEVISGVAPVQYGDLTDGAVIINRQAGPTNFQFSTRFNGASTNFSLTKGFKLKGQQGALNTNINYLISNADPRDLLKKYKRISGGIMWTRNFSKIVKNTFSADFSEKLDDAKADPYDNRHRLTYSKNRRFAFSERISAEVNGSFLKRINLTAGGDISNTESYTEYWLNGAQKPSAVKDTTGVYEGFYTEGIFTAVDHIVGKPINFNANLSFLNEVRTGDISHALSLGLSYSLSSNKGQGVISDPDRPRWAGLNDMNDRPYDFEALPSLVNFGMYAEDKFSFKIFENPFNVAAGVRYDQQNGYGSIQPRINTSYHLSKDLSFNLAYGIATKAPTMAYRFPSPTYFDVTLLNYYTGNAKTDLLLVYTRKITPDYSNLKPSRSSQIELGFSLNKKMFNSSIFGYFKKNSNGFNPEETFYPMTVPVYAITERPGQKPLYYATGETRSVTGLKASTVNNNVKSENYGVEWFISTKKIKQIQTSFSFNAAFTFSDYWNDGFKIRKATDDDIISGKKAWYGIYETIGNRNWTLTSRLNSDTHVPKLGLVVSFYADVVWQRFHKNFDSSRYPIAYLDQYSNYYPIQNFDTGNSDYGHLAKFAGSDDPEGKLPFSYANLSMRLAKEIKKKIRISINAYNILNIRPAYYDLVNNKRTTYNDPTSVGAELTIKF